MKQATIFQRTRGLLLIPVIVSCLVLSPRLALAQYDPQYDPYPETAEIFSREELAQLLAPIALYPDPLLSQILMASTYPIEVIEADRWLRRNPQLHGDPLDWALADRDWDPSVKALCHFPTILALMSERIAETSDLGNAFLAQEAEVMAMVQELRGTAYAQGSLVTTAQQRVIVGRETIIIEPANPRVIYVPYYDPFLVYGPWWYPAYPPYYWGPPGVSVVGVSYWPGISFSFVFGSWSTFDWHRRTIFIDVHKRPKFVRHDRWVTKPGPWHHAPVHRRGFAYHDAATAGKFGQPFKRSADVRRQTGEFPERGQVTRERNRRIEDRGRSEKGRGGDDRSGLERNRPISQPVESERQLRERSARESQEQGKRQRVQQGGKHIEREQADRDRQQRQLVDRDRQVRQKGKGEGELRGRVEREQQERAKIDRERREREGAERGQQPRSRDNGGKQVQAVKKDIEADESGKFNRQGSDEDGRGRGRSGGDRGDGRNGRDSRGDNRR